MDPLVDSYLQHGCLSAKDKIISIFSTSLPFTINASKAATLYIKSLGEVNEVLPSSTVKIKPYSGVHPVVLKIKNYLNSLMYHDLVGAYVHGSAATQELIPYSDFDGLLIIKDEVLKSPSRIKRLAVNLNKTADMMLELDPLQHHGWMLLAESDLHHYDNSFFPLELFNYASSLLDKGQELTLLNDSSRSDYKTPFNKLIFTLQKKTSRPCPENLYEIKILLSEFMLLPALYIQAVEKKGIFKGESFSAAAKYFKGNEWAIMNDVSTIREKWNYKISVSPEMNARRFRKIPVLSKVFHTAAPSELKTTLN
ncbi:MAG: hypothetical protein ABI772_12955, partial [Bacteroidota bacterium]